MATIPPPVNDMPIYGDDDDDSEGVRPKYLSGLHYTELVYSPLEVSLIVDVDIDHTHPHVFDTELTFVDLAIRKILQDDNFHVWKVEVESHHLSDIHPHPVMADIFECDYHGIFSVGLMVDTYETDMLGLKEEMEVSLQTSMNTGKFELALIKSFQIQKEYLPKHPGESIEGFLLHDMDVYNDEFKVTTIVSLPPPEFGPGHPYYEFLNTKWDDSHWQKYTITEHRFTHVYVAMTVFALTLACLFLSYGCFMSRACHRIRKRKASNTLSGREEDHSRTQSHGHELEVEEVLDEIVGEEMAEDGVVTSNQYHDTETIAF